MGAFGTRELFVESIFFFLTSKIYLIDYKNI